MHQKTNTVSSVIKDDLCVGCGTCIAICPTNAIVLHLDQSKGVYVPEVLEGACCNCGKCLRVCPGHEVDFPTLNETIFGDRQPTSFLGHHIACYIGHAIDPDLRYHCASGGLITSLLIFALEQGLITGALVTRTSKEKPLEPEPFIARTKEELIEASKSKYCPVPANIAIKEIINAGKDEKFAVVGLPCHIHGVRKAEMIDANLQKKIVLHIGIMCAHTDTFRATEYTLRSHDIRPEDVIGLDYRGHGWPGSMFIRLQDGKSQEIPYKQYIKPFHSYNFFTPRRCLQCYDATGEFSDISTGDAWDLGGFEENTTGESIFLCRNEEGLAILKMFAASNKFKLTSTTSRNVIRSQQGLMYTKKVALPFRLFILKLFGKENPDYCIDSPLFQYFIPFDATLPVFNSIISEKNYLYKILIHTPKKVVDLYGSLSLCMARLWMKYWERSNRS